MLSRSTDGGFADGTNAKIGGTGFPTLDKSDVPSTEPERCYGTNGMNTASCLTCCENPHSSCLKYAPPRPTHQCDENKGKCLEESSKGDEPKGTVCTEVSNHSSECLDCCVSKTPYDKDWYLSCPGNWYEILKGNDIPHRFKAAAWIRR